MHPFVTEGGQPVYGRDTAVDVVVVEPVGERVTHPRESWSVWRARPNEPSITLSSGAGLAVIFSRLDRSGNFVGQAVAFYPGAYLFDLP